MGPLGPFISARKLRMLQRASSFVSICFAIVLKCDCCEVTFGLVQAGCLDLGNGHCSAS